MVLDVYKTPVIIPAYNEEASIAHTLTALPEDLVEPIVAVNGSSDRTASIAESLGARVINFPERGKLPALQGVMRRLGKKALQPLIILDADTYPVRPRQWHSVMVAQLDNDREHNPIVIGAPVWYTGRDFLNYSLRSLRRASRAIEARVKGNGDQVGQYGPNMAVHFKNEEVLEAVLALPHYWPREDKAVADTVLEHQGVCKQPVTPNLLAVSPASISFLSLSESRRLGIQASRQKIRDLYAQRGAAGSIPYLG